MTSLIYVRSGALVVFARLHVCTAIMTATKKVKKRAERLCCDFDVLSVELLLLDC
jgi:hypothetical protein